MSCTRADFVKAAAPYIAKNIVEENERKREEELREKEEEEAEAAAKESEPGKLGHYFLKKPTKTDEQRDAEREARKLVVKDMIIKETKRVASLLVMGKEAEDGGYWPLLKVRRLRNDFAQLRRFLEACVTFFFFCFTCLVSSLAATRERGRNILVSKWANHLES